MENCAEKYSDNLTDVFIKLDEGGQMPKYCSLHAAGCDLFATQDMVIQPGETKLMPLNFRIALQPDMEAQIRPRSGLSLKTQLRMPNGVGTVDSDFRDHLCVILQNTFNIANLPYQISQNPEIVKEIAQNYSEISVFEYLRKYRNMSENIPDMRIMEQTILVDRDGNPYGTIHIKKDERIAQMIINEFRRANFILHDSPESIGHNRGGGFGSTGSK